MKFILNLTTRLTYHHHEWRNPGGSPNVMFFSHRIYKTNDFITSPKEWKDILFHVLSWFSLAEHFQSSHTDGEIVRQKYRSIGPSIHIHSKPSIATILLKTTSSNPSTSIDWQEMPLKYLSLKWAASSMSLTQKKWNIMFYKYYILPRIEMSVRLFGRPHAAGTRRHIVLTYCKSKKKKLFWKII